MDINKWERCNVCVCERERKLGEGGWYEGCRQMGSAKAQTWD